MRFKLVENIYSGETNNKKNSLVEAKQVGILYRFCNPLTIDTILDKDMLESYNYPYISFTRNSSPNFTYVGQQPRTIFRLVIDGDKLSDTYSIKPYSDLFYAKNDNYNAHYRGKSEQEEIVESPIKNISKYLLHIDLILDDLAEDENFLSKNNDDKFFKHWTLGYLKDVIHLLIDRYNMRVFLNGKKISVDQLINYNLLEDCKFNIEENIYTGETNNKKNKRKKHSLSPFINLDAGNVEYNVSMFNKAMGNETSAETGAVSEALNESLNENTVNSLIKEYMDVLTWLEDK